MYKFISFIFCIYFISTNAFAQQNSLAFGTVTKVKKGTNNMNVIGMDGENYLISETHLPIKRFNSKRVKNINQSAILLKFDKSMKLLFEKDFDDELDNMTFTEFIYLESKLYILATDIKKDNSSIVLLFAEVDKNSGKLMSDWKEINKYENNQETDVSQRVVYNNDSTGIILITAFENKESCNYRFARFDKNFISISKSLSIKYAYEAGLFQLEDFIFTKTDQLIVIGKLYYKKPEKKYEYYLFFKNLDIKVYNPGGLMIHDMTPVNVDEMLSGKLLNNKKGETFLLSINAKKDNTSENKLYTQKFNNESVKFIFIDSISHNNFNYSFNIKQTLFYQDDIIITGESASITPVSLSNTVGGVLFNSRIVYFNNNEFFVLRVNNSFNIHKLHFFWKEQEDRIFANQSRGSFAIQFQNTKSFFDNNNNFPLYSGIFAFISKKHLNIIYNDSEKNNEVILAGQKGKKISGVKNEPCYNLRLNLIDGVTEKLQIHLNKNEYLLMPKFSQKIGNQVLILGKSNEEDNPNKKPNLMLGRLVIED